MKPITQYFRNAILASLQGTITYKDRLFVTITKEEVEDGSLFAPSYYELCGEEPVVEEEKEEFKKNVIIALKTVATEYLDGGNECDILEEMSSILFLPAKLYNSGRLRVADEKYPWIPREYLEPMIDEQIAIGSIDDYDDFFETSTDERNQIDDWVKHLAYAKRLYKTVTKSEFSNDFIEKKEIKTDGKFYIFEDDTINATFHLKQLYNDLLESDEPKLYSKITNGRVEPSRPIANSTCKEKMIFHSGQMGGEYPLSPSQREAISCFRDVVEGEILAVNGPPGTGKTTLLQTIVANMYVNAALSKKDAPVIVATSTNNQAVTNIMESFAKINPIGISNLEQRWISGVNNFAVYFPSQGKINEAIKKGYQYATVQGGGFIENVENEENRKQSMEVLIEEYQKYFKIDFVSVQETVNRIHQELANVNCKRIEALNNLEKLQKILGNKTSGEYLLELDTEIRNIETQLEELKSEKKWIEEKGRQLINRRNEWRQSYDTLPWYVRGLKFIPYFKRKIIQWSYDNMAFEELEFLTRGMTITEIEDKYDNIIQSNDQTYIKVLDDIVVYENKQTQCISHKNSVLESVDDIYKSFAKFADYKVNLEPKTLYINVDIDELNKKLDKVRYVEFWLAVHYYEALWLSRDYPITENQKGKNFEDVLDKMYRRLTMLTPCMVMTCFVLPKHFKAYDGNEKKNYYMYNYADLLVVDEAGQISPEIGVPAFAFAKRAVVVGDEQQIPPVWGTPKALDIAMAISNDVIRTKDDFVQLENCGLNCSNSSVMKVASLSCPFEKFGKGLFLSEHRRCYNEIVQYCNDLVYEGCLEPLRGFARTDEKNVLDGYLPPMGYKHIESAVSERCGTSRQNRVEAEGIVFWIERNFSILCEKYKMNAESNGDEFKSKEILGIITPFKCQSFLIKQLIRNRLPEYEELIAVGTVHTFQGAERKVIIFSSVYGNTEGCFFINANKSLMNVAVSRAKDSFLVFGDRGCLRGGGRSAGELLKKKVQEEIC